MANNTHITITAIIPNKIILKVSSEIYFKKKSCILCQVLIKKFLIGLKIDIMSSVIDKIIFYHFLKYYTIDLKFIQSFVTIYLLYGGIGEGVNTPDCGSGMRGFESHISPQIVFIPLFKGFLFFSKPYSGLLYEIYFFN